MLNVEFVRTSPECSVALKWTGHNVALRPQTEAEDGLHTLKVFGHSPVTCVAFQIVVIESSLGPGSALFGGVVSCL